MLCRVHASAQEEDAKQSGGLIVEFGVSFKKLGEGESLHSYSVTANLEYSSRIGLSATSTENPDAHGLIIDGRASIGYFRGSLEGLSQSKWSTIFTPLGSVHTAWNPSLRRFEAIKFGTPSLSFGVSGDFGNITGASKNYIFDGSGRESVTQRNARRRQ